MSRIFKNRFVIIFSDINSKGFKRVSNKVVKELGKPNDTVDKGLIKPRIKEKFIFVYTNNKKINLRQVKKNVLLKKLNYNNM